MEEANVFKGYYRVIFISFGVILLIAFLLASWQFQSRFKYEVSLIEDQLKENTAQLESIIQVAKAGLYGIRSQAELYLKDPRLIGEAPQEKYLNYQTEENFYYLDSLPPAWQEGLGNITGVGDPQSLSPAIKRYLEITYRLSPLLKSSLENSPNSVLAYNSFDDNFVNVYPFISAQDFHVNTEFFDTFHQTYAQIYPEKNPDREIIWTEIYPDEIGKGLMVSAVIPFYEKGKHVGLSGIDLTLDSLNTIVVQSQRKQGEIFLVNEYQQLMAHPRLASSDKEKVPKLALALPDNLESYRQQWNDLAQEEIIYADQYLIYKRGVRGTPWELVYIVKAWDIYLSILGTIGISLLFVILSIGGIMAVSTYYTRHRFIQPAGALVRRLKNEYNNEITKEEKLPEAWQPWFEVVKEIFSKNRQLVQDLEEYNRELEFKVQERTEEIMTQNEELLQNQEEISSQRDYIELKNKELEGFNQKLSRNEEILRKSLTKLGEKNKVLEQKERLIGNSIRAALSIQSAMLPYPQRMQESLGEHFVLYKPRDVVSGDFYWLAKVKSKSILIVADCTGHGVPGALMSMIGSSILDKVVTLKQTLDPDKILEEVHEEVYFALKQGETQNSNGMDMAVLVWETTSNGAQLTFAGAKRPLYIWNSATSAIEIIKGSRRSLGGYQNKNTPFDVHHLSLERGSKIYMASDGYEDQNNAKRKKLGEKRFMKSLGDIQSQNLAQQKETLEAILAEHQQDEEQRDDILMIGFEV